MDSLSWLIRPPTRDGSTTAIEAPGSQMSLSRASTDYSQKPDFTLRTPALSDRTSFLRSRTSSRASSQRTSIVDATVQCPICFESMTTPKTLPCLHNICKRCLKQYILSHLRNELQHDIAVQTFPCPVCKEDTKPPQPCQDYEKWASMFPTNFFLHAYGMILTVQREEVDCDSCTRRGETTRASWWCRECSEYQCNVCKTVHGGFKLFKHHDVKAIKDIAENPDIAVPKNDSCVEHKEKITHFCKSHKSPSCATCLVTSHRKCDRVITIEEEFQSLKDRGEFAKLGETLREFEDMAFDLIEHRKRSIEDLEARKQEIINEVAGIRTKFEENLKKLETKLLEDFDKFHDVEIKQLKDLANHCENLGKQISNAVKLVDTVQQSGSESHVVGLMGKINRECKKYKRAINEGQTELQDVTYEFQTDSVLEHTLKSIKHIGNIKIKRSSKIPEAVIAGSQNYQSAGKAREVREMRIWISSDRGRCGIVGGVYFDDDKILLADYDNFKLKLFNELGRPINNLPLKKKPTDIAMIDRHKFVVTFPSASSVQFIQLEKNVLTAGASISTPRMFFSVTFHDQHLYFLSSTGISVCDIEAKEIRFIKPEEHGVSAAIGPGHIKATSDGLIITDQEKNTVNLLTLDGDPIHSFSSKDIKSPNGCDVDMNGNVFVCAKNSVFQFSSDGEIKRTLLSEKDGVFNPVIIGLQRQNSKFFIADSKISKKDYLRIFEWI